LFFPTAFTAFKELLAEIGWVVSHNRGEVDTTK